MSDAFDPARLQSDIVALLTRVRSVSLASVHADGMPLASYAPFAVMEVDAGFWVLLSELAAHARNLREHPDCSVLALADEADSAQIYVRERCQYEMQAARVDRGTSDWRLGCDRLRARHGSLVDTLEQLADFQLFRLRPVSGRYVVGFGRAYALEPGTLTLVAAHLQGPTGPIRDDLSAPDVQT